MELGKALTWDELANIYDACRKGRPARTLPMEQIFKWAEVQTTRFKVTDDGYIHEILLK